MVLKVKRSDMTRPLCCKFHSYISEGKWVDGDVMGVLVSRLTENRAFGEAELRRQSMSTILWGKTRKTKWEDSYQKRIIWTWLFALLFHTSRMIVGLARSTYHRKAVGNQRSISMICCWEPLKDLRSIAALIKGCLMVRRRELKSVAYHFRLGNGRWGASRGFCFLNLNPQCKNSRPGGQSRLPTW